MEEIADMLEEGYQKNIKNIADVFSGQSNFFFYFLSMICRLRTFVLLLLPMYMQKKPTFTSNWSDLTMPCIPNLVKGHLVHALLLFKLRLFFNAIQLAWLICMGTVQ